MSDDDATLAGGNGRGAGDEPLGGEDLLTEGGGLGGQAGAQSINAGLPSAALQFGIVNADRFVESRLMVPLRMAAEDNQVPLAPHRAVEILHALERSVDGSDFDQDSYRQLIEHLGIEDLGTSGY
jgi:hypothetical protein